MVNCVNRLFSIFAIRSSFLRQLENPGMLPRIIQVHEHKRDDSYQSLKFQTIFTKHSRLSERNSGHFRLLNFAVQFNQTLSFSVTAQSSSWIHIEQLFTDGEVNRGRNFPFRCGLYLRKRKWAKKTVTLYVLASAHAKGAKTGRDFHLLAHGLSLHTHEVCIWICLVSRGKENLREKINEEKAK